MQLLKALFQDDIIVCLLWIIVFSQFYMLTLLLSAFSHTQYAPEEDIKQILSGSTNHDTFSWA